MNTNRIAEHKQNNFSCNRTYMALIFHKESQRHVHFIRDLLFLKKTIYHGKIVMLKRIITKENNK